MFDVLIILSSLITTGVAIQMFLNKRHKDSVKIFQLVRWMMVSLALILSAILWS